jgi:hypothetical protein
VNEEDRTYTVTNSEGQELKFTGELVSHVSAQLPEKQRWTEFTLYLTDFDTWILHGVGKSRIPGESDRHWYIVSSEPSDWIEKIVGDDVSRLAKKLLRDAFQYLKDCESENY